MNEARQNDSIWEYFQNEAPHVFGGGHAHPRLEFLVGRVGRLAATPRPRVLNIGIGDGHFERTAQQRGWRVSALDPSAESVQSLAASDIDARRGRLEQLPFADDSFDFVVASEVLEHLTADERQRGLAEIQRVLVPGGYLLGTVPYREVLEDNLAICPKCHEVFHRWGHTTSFDMPRIRGELTPHFTRTTCRVTAFVQFRGRSLGGRLKSMVRLALAKCGARVAVPNILFQAQKALPKRSA
jgi:SAM-dependent methyltransferase